MFKLKDNFELLLTNGQIVKNKVWADNSILHLADGEDIYIFQDGMWFVKTPLTNDNYISLGYGATPGFTLAEDVNVENENAFNALFDKVEDAKA